MNHKRRAPRYGIFGFSLFRPSIAKRKAQGDIFGLVQAFPNAGYQGRSQIEAIFVEWGKSAVEPLLELLEDPDEKIREVAAHLLAPIADERCTASFVRLLQEKSILLRGSAVSGLTRCRDAAAIEGLCVALHDEDTSVQELAARALSGIADARAVAPLVEAAQAPNAPVHVQKILRSVLDRFAETVSEEALQKAARMNDSYVLIFAQVESSCSFTTFHLTNQECDFSQIKQMARQELIRRGLNA